MNPLALMTVAATLAIGTASTAFAQEKHYRDGGFRYPNDAYPRTYSRDGGYRSGGYRDGGHRHYDRWARPHYYPRHYYPYVYPAPLFGYYPPYPLYAAVPEPVYVERYRVYEDDWDLPPPRPREYRERSYAQVEPAPRPAPQPAPTPAPPAPRFERYTLSAQELFAFDKAEVRSPQPKLDEIARAMAQDSRIDNVMITGYTDRLGSDAYNLALSQRRADAVKRYLVDKGVAPRRLKAVGKGKSNPVVQCNDRDRAQLIRCLEPNRRVEVESITVERQAPPAAR